MAKSILQTAAAASEGIFESAPSQDNNEHACLSQHHSFKALFRSTLLATFIPASFRLAGELQSQTNNIVVMANAHNKRVRVSELDQHEQAERREYERQLKRRQRSNKRALPLNTANRINALRRNVQVLKADLLEQTRQPSICLDPAVIIAHLEKQSPDTVQAFIRSIIESNVEFAAAAIAEHFSRELDLYCQRVDTLVNRQLSDGIRCE